MQSELQKPTWSGILIDELWEYNSDINEFSSIFFPFMM